MGKRPRPRSAPPQRTVVCVGDGGDRRGSPRQPFSLASNGGLEFSLGSRRWATLSIGGGLAAGVGRGRGIVASRRVGSRLSRVVAGKVGDCTWMPAAIEASSAMVGDGVRESVSCFSMCCQYTLSGAGSPARTAEL